MYELKIYVDGNEPHYVKVSEDGLHYFREALADTISSDFIEIYCYDEECYFGVCRGKVDAYSYKEINTDNEGMF